MGWPESDPEFRSYLAAFTQEMPRLGWIEGRNFRTPDIGPRKDVRSWRVKPVRTGLGPHAFPHFFVLPGRLHAREKKPNRYWSAPRNAKRRVISRPETGYARSSEIGSALVGDREQVRWNGCCTGESPGFSALKIRSDINAGQVGVTRGYSICATSTEERECAAGKWKRPIPRARRARHAHP
jgi:hypothetical protein